jgi:hypothetical protein
MEMYLYDIYTTKFMQMNLETSMQLSTDRMNLSEVKIDQQTSSFIFEKMVNNITQWLKTHL